MIDTKQYLEDTISLGLELTHEDHTKCGTCWRVYIRNETAKKYLDENKVADEDLQLYIKDCEEQWRRTDLYKRVAEMRDNGLDFETITEMLAEEGIEI